jgi:acyl-CoA synthetase (AMP-forming)/AMP-acid ligase II
LSNETKPGILYSVNHHSHATAGISGEAEWRARIAEALKALTTLRRFQRAHMAKYKVSTSVEFLADLPKSVLGKALHRKLIEEHT